MGLISSVRTTWYVESHHIDTCTMFTLIERKLKKLQFFTLLAKVVTCYIKIKIHCEMAQNMDFLALIRSCISLA